MELKAGEISHTEKQPKPKKTNAQKRIIASNIAIYCMCAALASTLPGLTIKNNYDKDIKELDNKQNAIYEEFMACEEFSDVYKSEFTKASNDYINGLITYEEFDKKVKHLNSIEYAQEMLANSNNTELKSQVEEIEQKKEERTEKYQSNPVVNGGLIGLVGLGAASLGSIITSTAYCLKESAEEKRKKKMLTNMPGVIEPIIKKNSNETQNSIELSFEFDETSDSINIVTTKQKDKNAGIKYYDSTTMTIKNTNSKDEENEETLSK